MDVTIVIPVFNQLHYTKQCLESLNASGCSDAMIIVVNNASTDGTREYLAKRKVMRVIDNAENLACSTAWNQGFRAAATTWTLFLNNDVVVPSGWLENLVAFAESEKVDIACPALGEGDLDYDLKNYAHNFMAKMKQVRRDMAHGVCFLVHRKVFEVIGGFDENFRKGGCEDADFFLRAQRAGLKLAMTGGAYIHHFGSKTQKTLKAERGSTRAETVGYFRSKWKIGWTQRKWARLRRQLIGQWWKWNERWKHGRTLRQCRCNGKWSYH